MEIETIAYKHGMLKKLSHKKRLKASYFIESEITDEIKKLIMENDILSLSGKYGNKEAGFPIEYEEVKIKSNGEWVTFEVYNKGISVINNESEELKKLFPLCCKLNEKYRL